MEFLLRFAACILKLIGYLLTPLFILFTPFKRTSIPPITNNLLTLPVVDLAEKIRRREVTSEQVVRAYIERCREVNPYLNAIVEDRFQEAIEDAKRVDKLIEITPTYQLLTNYPILGVPFTVKESCSLKGMSYSVGSLTRQGIRSTEDGHAVEHLKAAGGIPLLVSNTPEFCTSWESNNKITGRTLNPFDTRRTAGGSSGGEGALIGSGASLFGIGSDIAGSIRIPAMFNGIFGHKPTGGLLSIKGHFPTSTDEAFAKYLVVGPMCRYARDLPTLLHIMAGPNADKLRLNEPLYTKDIKIFYKVDAGFSFVDIPVQPEIKIAIRRAAEHFQANGLETQEAPIGSMQKALESGLAQLFSIEDIPLILKDPDNPKKIDNVYTEIFKSMFGKSKYSFAGLFFCFLYYTNGFIAKKKIPNYLIEAEKLKAELLNMLGDNGVLFYPTYPVSALRHNDSFAKICGVVYSMTFNLLGFPSTHVPLGKDRNGLPIGFQVVAAPYQDRLCLCIANEIEAAFGGWTPPN